MHIALPIVGNRFSSHFGQSRSFAVFETDDGTKQIVKRWEIPVPDQGGCSVIPAVLAKQGVNVVLAGGMGAGAVNKLRLAGIEAIVGVVGADPEAIVLDYLKGQLAHSNDTCQHHEGHGHGGHCHRHGSHHD